MVVADPKVTAPGSRHSEVPENEIRTALVIRVAGEAGEGIKKPGELLIQAAARAGFEVLTDFAPPSEIKGGVSFFQIRLSPNRLFTRGDSPDVLLCFNQEAFEVNIQELVPGGLLIYDPEKVTPRETSGYRLLAFPLEQIASKELRMPIVKNVVALGGMAALFQLDTTVLYDLIRELWERKGDAVVQTNFRALEAGIKYVQEHVSSADLERFHVLPHAVDPNRIVVAGNTATALGAIAGGCNFFAGYPITPATDVMELLATALPKVGGTLVQAEDEIAALGMVIGASYGGKKAMTSTSGPGISLMVETLGLATMSETACVIVDAQRAGPSTGMPTRHEQGDLYLCVHGGHGEVPRIVLAATSVEDCFYLTVAAFNLAEKYQTPVIFMSDTVVCVRSESIPTPDLANLHIENRLTWTPPAEGATAFGESEGAYKRYAITETGISPVAIPGTPGGQYVGMGLEHTERGRHRPDPRTHTQMTEKRFRKMDHAETDAPAPILHGDPDADIAIVTWGSTAGVAIEAINTLAAEGIHACLVAPKMISPLPRHQLASAMGKKHVIIPEVNFRGQFADMVQAAFPRAVTRVNVYGGRPMLVCHLVDAIRDVAEGRQGTGRVVLNPIIGDLDKLVTPDDLIAPLERH
jgi:2-oxoglutarate ferredoxin oxidoreductase subunit alpha